jgi:hypothetical protein
LMDAIAGGAHKLKKVDAGSGAGGAVPAEPAGNDVANILAGALLQRRETLQEEEEDDDSASESDDDWSE